MQYDMVKYWKMYSKDYIAEVALNFQDLLFIGLYSNVVIIGFIVFLVKITQLNFAKFYLTRMYMVFIDVSWLLGFAISIQYIFAYSYMLGFNIKTLAEEEIERKGNFTIGWIFNALKYFNESPFT